MKIYSIPPAKLSKWLLTAAGMLLVLPGCQRTVTSGDRYSAIIQRDQLMELRAQGAEKSMALIRREADVGNLRAEEIRPVISSRNVRLPKFVDPGPEKAGSGSLEICGGRRSFSS